jgi:hypothetical protein
LMGIIDFGRTDFLDKNAEREGPAHPVLAEGRARGYGYGVWTWIVRVLSSGPGDFFPQTAGHLP